MDVVELVEFMGDVTCIAAVVAFGVLFWGGGDPGQQGWFAPPFAQFQFTAAGPHSPHPPYDRPGGVVQ